MTMPTLPEHFGSDMLACGLSGMQLIFLVGFGCLFIDFIWRKLDLIDQVQKGNIAAGIVLGCTVIGLFISVALVMTCILG
jgi:hypothetical protein